MIVLGIDPGLATTGFGVVSYRNGKVSLVEYGVLKTLPRQNFPERLDIIGKDMEEIIQEFKPDLSAVESLFFAKNTKTAISVAHARGVVLFVLKNNLIPILEFTPLQVKSSICGYGQAEKSQVQRLVASELNLKEVPSQDDAADALAVAICGAYQSKEVYDLS